MFRRILTGFVAALVLSTGAIAAPGPNMAGPSKAFDIYVSKTAKETGVDREKVREKAEARLRELGVEKADLARIGELSRERQESFVNLLSTDANFHKAVTGVASFKLEAAERRADKAFDALAKQEKNPVANDNAGKKPMTQAEKDATVFAKAEQVMGAKAVEVVKNAGSKNFELMRSLLKSLANRVNDGMTTKDEAIDLLVDISKSPRVFKGELIAGRGAAESCRGIAEDARKVYAKGVKAAVNEGKDNDPVSGVRAGGKAMGAEFKQTEEEGVARFCAVANAGCGLFSSVVQDACAEMAAAAM